jgi:hypothetical protein
VTKYSSPTGQLLNSYWLAIMWNVWSFDNVKAKIDVKNKNDNCVKWWSRVNYLVHNTIFRLHFGYFKMATSQSSTTPCRPALSWNVFRTIASLIFPTTMKVFEIQDVDAYSCMVRFKIFLNFEVPTMKFRGLQ